MSHLKTLIQQAEQKCMETGLIGESRDAGFIVQVQKLDRQVRNTVPTFRIDIWRIDNGKARKLKKDEWSKL